MKYLTEPCTRCNKKNVIPPLIKDLKSPLIFVRCDGCGKTSRYNVVDHADVTQSYTLSKWGRNKIISEHIQKKRAVNFSDFEMRMMRKKDRTPNQLAKLGYRIEVLGLDK